jgi:hypothetical protein
LGKIPEWRAYKIQLVQQVAHKNHATRKRVALEMLSRTEEEETCLCRLFSEEVTFM